MRMPVPIPVLMVALSSPAAAESWSAPDPTDDVHRYHYDNGVSGCEVDDGIEEPTTPKLDITRLGVRHRSSGVRIRVTYADVPAKGRLRSSFRLRTAAGEYGLYVDARYFLEGESLFIWRAPDPEPPCGTGSTEPDTIHCRHARARYAVDRDRLTIRVPRHCLAEPTWVRVSASTYAEADHESRSDWWGTDGFSVSGDAPFSPRVRADDA